jgi:hypothetical protein
MCVLQFSKCVLFNSVCLSDPYGPFIADTNPVAGKLKYISHNCGYEDFYILGHNVM